MKKLLSLHGCGQFPDGREIGQQAASEGDVYLGVIVGDQFTETTEVDLSLSDVGLAGELLGLVPDLDIGKGVCQLPALPAESLFAAFVQDTGRMSSCQSRKI